MAGEVIVDALPYIDQGYDEPGVREAASAMVEEECRRFRPTKNYLEHLPPLNVTAFETAMMHTEFERLQNRLPMDTMSMKRYELPPPPSGKLNEEKAWFECVENSQAQLEHQAVRILNLQLMLEYCCPAWQRYLQTLSDCEKIASKKIVVLRQALQEVNWQRKSLQTKGGEQLRSLEAKWVALVSHNYEIEQACCLAEEYIANMSSQLKTYKQQQEEYQRQREENPHQEVNQEETRQQLDNQDVYNQQDNHNQRDYDQQDHNQPDHNKPDHNKPDHNIPDHNKPDHNQHDHNQQDHNQHDHNQQNEYNQQYENNQHESNQQTQNNQHEHNQNHENNQQLEYSKEQLKPDEIQNEPQTDGTQDVDSNTDNKLNDVEKVEDDDSRMEDGVEISEDNQSMEVQ